MAFDFPPSPAVGTLYPAVAIAGTPQYRWNGTEWTAATLDPAGYVRKSGDAMTGALSLAGDPTQALHAVPKQYLDGQKQRISLAGGKSFDVQVPAGAELARLTALVRPTSAAPIALVVQLSVAAGVFRGTAGDYVTSGLYNNSNAATIGAVHNAVIYTGMLASSGHDNASVPVHMDGTITLKRPTSGLYFNGDFRHGSFGGAGAVHGFFYNYATLTSFGSALDVLAFRLTNNGGGGDNWGAGSYLTVEWL